MLSAKRKMPLLARKQGIVSENGLVDKPRALSGVCGYYYPIFNFAELAWSNEGH